MKRLWWLFVAVLVVSFAVLSWIGTRIYQEKPPLPDKVVTTSGDVVIDVGRDSGRAECLADAGRHGGRFDLGSRQLCRARLDRRLAAPRGDVHSQSLGHRTNSAATSRSLARNSRRN